MVAGGVGQRANTTAVGLAEQATRGHALVPQTPRSAGGFKLVKRVRLLGKPCVELEAAVAARDTSDESHNHPHVPGREAACVAWVVAGRTRHILASHGPAGTKAPEQSSHFVIAHNVAVHVPRGARKPSQVGQHPIEISGVPPVGAGAGAADSEAVDERVGGRHAWAAAVLTHDRNACGRALIAGARARSADGTTCRRRRGGTGRLGVSRECGSCI